MDPTILSVVSEPQVRILNQKKIRSDPAQMDRRCSFKICADCFLFFSRNCFLLRAIDLKLISIKSKIYLELFFIYFDLMDCSNLEIAVQF